MSDGSDRVAVGVDLGGSHVMAAVVDEHGKIGTRREIDLTDLQPANVVTALVGCVRQALADAKGRTVAGIGIGSPGRIDVRTGTVRYSPNFAWRDVTLGAMVSKELQTNVQVINDARAATLGEHTFGAGRGTRNFVMLTLGTGIGGGIVMDGKLVFGDGWTTGEVGHHQIRAHHGFVCSCGKTGCFEAHASGTGLLRHLLDVAPSFPRSTLSHKARKLGSKAVREAAQAGDRHALEAWSRWIGDLAIGLANLVSILNPERIALGGGVSKADEFMLAPLVPRVRALTTMADPEGFQIVAAELANDAGAIGAATYVLRGT
ncbi:MAG TPA: ROK family protein [Candidatus Dormibacteraeota bacterium]|nr:ROK family protein [Candidatus Dormibacteraeota bacterium]